MPCAYYEEDDAERSYSSYLKRSREDLSSCLKLGPEMSGQTPQIMSKVKNLSG